MSKFPTQMIAAIAALAPFAIAGEALRVPAQFPTIQSAIDAAQTGDTVLVAPGVYTGAGNRDLNFNGKNITVRSVGGAETCTIDCASQPENTFRGFVFQSGETRDAVVEGFTIINGDTPPGAILDDFNGGAIRIREASPTIRNCVFRDNTAQCWGGGVYAGTSGSPLIDGCMFLNNTADDGGGFFSWLGAKTEIRNSVFIGNFAINAGGAIAEFGGGEFHLTNCTISANTGSTWAVGGIVDFGTGSTVRNSILWNNTGGDQVQGFNTSVAFSIVQGGMAGAGNLDTDPMFRADGFHLRASSPAVNAGSVFFVPSSSETDIDGERRVLNGVVDLGADEVGRDELPKAGEARVLRRG